MNKKMGRPTLPKGESQEAQVGVRFKPEVDRQLEKEAKKAGQTKAEAVRTATIQDLENPSKWFKTSKWQKEDLDEQLIDFKLCSKVPQGIRELEGVGKMSVRKNHVGEIAVDIFVHQMESPFKGVTTRIWLSKEAVERIELNPDQSKAKFRLLV